MSKFSQILAQKSQKMLTNPTFRSKNGDTPEKDPTPGSSPAPHTDPTPEPSMDQVTRDETTDSPQDPTLSRDVADSSRDVITTSRDVITPRDARHEYDKYEPDVQLPAGTSPAD